jgi:hypothetical protein
MTSVIGEISTGRRGSPVGSSWHKTVGRIAIPALLLVIGGIHLNLYLREQYREVPTVGWLFLMTVITSAMVAAALAIRPSWLTLALSGGFPLAVLAGYLLTLWLPNGLFRFKEPGVSYSGGVSIAAELLAAIASAGLFICKCRDLPVR